MSIPTHFYKYRSVAGAAERHLEGTILKHEIRFSFPHEFNDPFDCSVVYAQHEGTEEEVIADYINLARRIGVTESVEELRSQARDILRDPMRDPRRVEACREQERMYAFFLRGQIGVYCLSAVADDILMWSHYGQNHEGVCLQYSATAGLFAEAQRVAYSLLRPQLGWKDGEDAKLEKTLLCKSAHWKYEQEWRVIRPGGGGHIVTLPEAALSGVIVGAKASAKTMQRIRRWTRERSQPFNVFKAFLSPTTYSVEIRAVAPI